jgi:hypothetical protein
VDSVTAPLKISKLTWMIFVMCTHMFSWGRNTIWHYSG